MVVATSCGLMGRSSDVLAAWGALADDLTHPHAAATHQYAEDVAPVIAAAVGVHARGPAELAHRHHQGLLIQTALAQVLDQSSNRPGPAAG